MAASGGIKSGHWLEMGLRISYSFFKKLESLYKFTNKISKFIKIKTQEKDLWCQ